MPKKVVEKEEEIDVKKVEKPETFASRWFKDYAVNNADELRTVCELTARSVYSQFCIHLATENYETYAVMFFATFMAILDFIRGKQKSYNNFTIEICNSVNLGYTNNSDENNEKVGNFMPVMEYIGINRSIVDESSVTSEKTSVNTSRWMTLNTKKNVECYKEIEIKAAEILKNDYRILIREIESIIPIFCIFLDNITNLLKVKFQEADGTGVSQVSMNVLGLFDVYYSFDEDENREIIEFQPNIRMKLALKSDDTASRV